MSQKWLKKHQKTVKTGVFEKMIISIYILINIRLILTLFRWEGTRNIDG